ncbi:MAG: hypothetical protein DMF07_13615, partial [Verrucomicrobia bacterium]
NVIGCYKKVFLLGTESKPIDLTKPQVAVLESFKVYFALFRKPFNINWPYNCLQLFLKFSKGMLIFFIEGVLILFSEAIKRSRFFFKLPDEIVTSFKILFL